MKFITGYFHGEVLICADNMSHALFELAHISEKIDQIVDPSRSDLPAFLAKNSGLESGMMIIPLRYAGCISRNACKSITSLHIFPPTSGGQRRSVSMGAAACWNLVETSKHLSQVLACELLSCEALEYRVATSKSCKIVTLFG